MAVKVKTVSGHGGSDPGAISGGFKEKDFTLDIEKRVYDELIRHGIQATRLKTTDKTIDPNTRAKTIKNSDAEYCLDIHINAGGGEGAETIYSIHSNGKLANLILEELGKVGLKTRRAYSRKNSSGTDYYYMHRNTGNVQTVIIECAFIDNKNDLEFLKVAGNRQKIAIAITKGFLRHIGVVYKPVQQPKPASGVLYRVQIGAYSDINNANKMLEKAKKAGFTDAFIKKD